jgi:hypothetical protein
VAGAAAAAGLPLADVAAEAAAAAAAVGSMGVATSACTLPGGQPSDRWPLVVTGSPIRDRGMQLSGVRSRLRPRQRHLAAYLFQLYLCVQLVCCCLHKLNIALTH